MKKRVSMNYIKQQPALTDFQLELLKLFSFNISGDELLDIKRMLSNYFSNRLRNALKKSSPFEKMFIGVFVL